MRLSGNYPDCFLKIISHKNCKMSGYEMRCLLAWMSHKKGYNVTQLQISAETNINKSSVSKSFKRLVAKKILVTVGGVSNKGTRRTPVYDLHPNIYDAMIQINDADFRKIKQKETKPMTMEDIDIMFGEEELIEKELSVNLKKVIDVDLLKQLHCPIPGDNDEC